MFTKRAPLSVAAETEADGSTLLQVIIDGGEDVNEADKAPAGRTPLHSAAFGNKVGNIDVRIAAGADVEAKCTGLGYTPLHVATERGQVGAADALLRHSGNANALTLDNLAPLNWATSNLTGDTRALNHYLLEAGADETIEDEDGDTAADVVGSEDVDEDVAPRAADEEEKVWNVLEDGKRAANRTWRCRVPSW